MLVKDTITEITYWTMIQCVELLEEELQHYYRYGKGNPRSARKILQRYGFKIRRKDNLIKAVKAYLNQVDVVKGL